MTINEHVRQEEQVSWEEGRKEGGGGEGEWC